MAIVSHYSVFIQHSSTWWLFTQYLYRAGIECLLSIDLGECDRDACIQLDVIGHFCELLLLFLQRLQQPVNLLLRQNHPAVILWEGQTYT